MNLLPKSDSSSRGESWKGFRFEDQVSDQQLETRELLKDHGGFCGGFGG